MKVSVIVPAYNIENYIQRCLLSLVKQTLQDIEIIVVNDGSNDNTLEKIKEIQDKYNLVRLVNQKNKGSIEARKSGLKLARGKYILFVDGDDWLEENALELLYSNAIENMSDIVIYDAFKSFDDSKEKINTIANEVELSSDYIENLFLGKVVPSMCYKFINLEFIKSNNIRFAEDISFAEDLATVASLFMNNPKISILRENLYNYYQRQESITKKKTVKVLEINEAFSFIKNRLIEVNLYNKYKEAFEYMVFLHLFDNWFLGTYVEDEHIGVSLYNQYKSRKININNNYFIMRKLDAYNISLKFRIKAYNKSYKLGKFYDELRMKLCKKKLIYKQSI